MSKKINCIMLVDDDSLDNYFHKIIITKMNIAEKIITIENGVKALEYLKMQNESPPELIFLDINMPKMNGWEFLSQYKSLDESEKAKIVILMLTTSLNPYDKERAEKISEISGFIVKPLSEEILKDILEEHFPEVYKDLDANKE